MSNVARHQRHQLASQQREPLTYEQEQEVLRRRVEGESGIHIEPPKQPEVNPEVYRDVIPLLFHGFLTVSAQIGGALFVFKSLNHHEFELLKFMGGLEKSGSYKYWDIFLAYNVFMVDGQNVLSDRDRWLPKITETFSEMDLKPKQHIIRHMSEINRRANNATILTECYAAEAYSRYRWAQLLGIDLCSPTSTGIPGTERLGMNWSQLTWRAINYYEDLHEAGEREWENAKFIGSCFAGKGIQKIYHQDTERRQKEREERFARKDKLLRQVMLGEKPDEKSKQFQGAVLTSRTTVEELAEQLEGDLRGEKDWHDQIVEEHMNRIKRNISSRQEQFREMAKRHDEEFNGKNVVGSTDFRGLSASEVQERIARRKQIEAQQASRRMVRPEIMEDPKSSGFVNKWGLAEGPKGVGFSVGQTDQDVSKAVPITPPRQGGTPFRRR